MWTLQGPAVWLLILAATQWSAPELPSEWLDRLSPATRTEVDDVRRSLDSNPDSPTALGRMGMLLQAGQQYEPALAYYRRALELAPEEFPWAYYIAVCHETMRDLATAESAYRHALELDPGYIPATLRLAELLADGGRWQESLELYRPVVEKLPELALGHFGMGRALEQLGDAESAKDHFRKACEFHRSFGAAHYALAQLLRSSGDRESAQRHLELYQQFKLNRPVVGDGLLQAIDQLKTGDVRAIQLLREAVAEGEKGNTERAIGLNLEAIEISPELAQAYLNLLILYARSGQIEEAEEIYQRGVGIAPNDEKLHYNFGVLLMQKERYPEAREAFLRALQINPLNADARINLGRIEEWRGEFDQAERQYAYAVEYGTDARLARFNLARIFLSRRQNEAAIEQLSRTLEPEDESTPRYLYALATAYVREGKLEDALAMAAKARDLAEKYAQSELLQSIERDLEKLRSAIPQAP